MPGRLVDGVNESSIRRQRDLREAHRHPAPAGPRPAADRQRAAPAPGASLFGVLAAERTCSRLSALDGSPGGADNPKNRKLSYKYARGAAIFVRRGTRK